MDELDPILPRPDGDANPTGKDGRSDEAVYQPAAEADLQRFPPRDEDCRWVRERLRARADDELDGQDRRRVDDHVHGCRDCGLALSRAELEVVRLRKALAPDAPRPAELPEDFTARVMAAVRREASTCAGSSHDGPPRTGAPRRSPAHHLEPAWIAPDAVGTPPDFTSSVMARVRREWRRPSPWERVSGRLGRTGLFAVAATLAVLVTAAVATGLLSRETAEVVRLEIAAVSGPAWIEAAGTGVRPVAPGARIAPGDVLRTSLEGSVMVELSGNAEVGSGEGAGPDGFAALRMEFADGARAEFAGEDGWVLDQGRAELWTERPTVLVLRGLGEVRMDRGGYDVSVQTARRFDSDSWPNADRRARVRVLEGHALLVRGSREAGGEVVPVPAGQVARFDAVSLVQVELAADDAMLERSRLAARERPSGRPLGEPLSPREVPVWAWQVVDRHGEGVPGAAVEVQVADGSRLLETTDAEGWIRFTADVQSGSPAIVRVAPAADSDLASFGPAPRRLSLAVPVRRELVPIMLAADLPVAGEVRDATGMPVAEARVLPCVVDEVFGRLERLESLSVRTDEEGRYVLRHLPRDLGPNQSLVLLVEASRPGWMLRSSALVDHRDGPPSSRDGFVHVDVHLGGRGARTIRGLSPEGTHVALRELPGIPLSAFTERVTVTVDADGEATIPERGDGRWWILIDGQSLHRLVPDDEEADEDSRALRMDTQPSSIPVIALEAMSDVRTSGLDPLDPRERYGHRFDDVWAQPRDGVVRFFAVADANGSVVPRTCVFIELSDGTIHYVGSSDGREVVPVFERESWGDRRGAEKFRVFAIADDGSVGVLPSEQFFAGGDHLVVHRPGALAMDEEVRARYGGDALLSIEPIDGPLGGRSLWRRARDGEVSDLPAGPLRVTFPDGHVVDVTAERGREATLTLR